MYPAFQVEKKKEASIIIHFISFENFSEVDPLSHQGGDGEVAIRIIGSGDSPERNNLRVSEPSNPIHTSPSEPNLVTLERQNLLRDERNNRHTTLPSSLSTSSLSSLNQSGNSAADNDAAPNGGSNRENGSTNAGSTYQRYDIQQVARWIEQILPFSILLLVVFIRQHLQGMSAFLFLFFVYDSLLIERKFRFRNGNDSALIAFAGFFVTIWIAAVMFKSNDVLRKQTALKVYTCTQLLKKKTEMKEK